ncbi:hypothetical protein ACAG12_26510, partial [Escherichia coli]|uniref:hypothetical protein n=1 Tax=Escherichia coli TaxID=562 RepID=UPI003FCEC494
LSNQKFLDAFLAQEENQQLCQRVIASPDDTQKRNELNSRIQEFYAELQLIKYISSLIRFTAIELAVRTQKIGKVFQPTDQIE